MIFFFLMDFPIQYAWDCPFCILSFCWSTFLDYDKFLSLKIVFILTNSADPDEMLDYAAFHLGLYCLPKHSVQYKKKRKLNIMFIGPVKQKILSV